MTSCVDCKLLFHAYMQTASEHQRKLLSPSLSEWKRCDLELQVQWREQAIEDVKDTIAKYEERLSELNFNCKLYLYAAATSTCAIISYSILHLFIDTAVQLCDPKIRTERGRIQKVH